jgi:hypothetical protein
MHCTQCGGQIADEARFCPSCGKPISSVEEKQVVEESPKEKTSKIVMFGGTFVVAMFLLAIYAVLSDSPSGKPSASSPPRAVASSAAQKKTAAPAARQAKAVSLSLTPDERAEVERIKSAGNIAGQMGHRIAQNITLFVLTDNFGENPSCAISIQAHDPKSSEVNQKWDLRVQIGNAGNVVWTNNALSNTANEIRLVISSHRYSLNKVMSGGGLGARLSSNLLNDLLATKSAKAISGKIGDMELSYTYDLRAFSKAYKFASAVCA